MTMLLTTDHPPRISEILNGAETDKVIYAGTHRVRTLSETVELAWEARALVGVSRVADVTGLDTLGIPVFNTLRPRAAGGNLTVTCGKGITRPAALASALMEAVESHCGEQHGRSGPVRSLHELSLTGKVLHPRALLLDRETSWTEEMPIEWWPYRNFATDEMVMLPAATAFTPYASPHPRLTASISDGLAAGNSLAEATLHALYELVERDCTAFGEVLKMGHRVPLDSLPPAHSELVERFHGNGIAVRVFSFSNDIGIPVFYVTIDDRQADDPLLFNGGAGCHLSPDVALYRALTEAAQSRLSIISGGREDIARHVARREEGYELARERADEWARGWPVRSFADHSDLSTGSLAEDLNVLRTHLSRAGLDRIYVTDLTLPGIPFSVVRVVVPGLEFFHQEPGRLGPRLHAAMKKRTHAGQATTRN
ncbi:YcaO-like family protein [Streptomyces sp. NPDC006463]|uniref:YcaO-like family protein n=1 Tax=Streptomyces sp. NPDC006463 TaxID=3364746 RepID=UPI0036A51631